MSTLCFRMKIMKLNLCMILKLGNCNLELSRFSMIKTIFSGEIDNRNLFSNLNHSFRVILIHKTVNITFNVTVNITANTNILKMYSVHVRHLAQMYYLLQIYESIANRNQLMTHIGDQDYATIYRLCRNGFFIIVIFSFFHSFGPFALCAVYIWLS